MRYLATLLKIDANYPEFGKFENIVNDAKYLNDQIERAANMDDGSFLIEQLDYNGIDDANELFLKVKGKPQDYCPTVAKYLRDDLIISNTGNYIYKNKRQDPQGPLKITEIYFGDSPVSNPQIEPALILHLSYWNDQIMFQLSSNRSAIGSVYSDRFVQLIDQNIQKLFA